MKNSRKVEICESRIILAELILVLFVMAFIEAPKFVINPSIIPIIITLSLLFVILCAVMHPHLIEDKKTKRYIGIIVLIISTVQLIWVVLSALPGNHNLPIIETFLMAMLYIGGFGILFRD